MTADGDSVDGAGGSPDDGDGRSRTDTSGSGPRAEPSTGGVVTGDHQPPDVPEADLVADPLPEAESRETAEAWEESDPMEGEAPTG